MTRISTQAWQLPLTVANYLAIPENGEVRYELQEGIPIGSPSPPAEHQICGDELIHQLRGQLPTTLRAVSSIDVNLELAPAWRPGFVRRPDLVLVSRSGLKRRRSENGLLRASDIALAVEVVSLGTRRMDYQVKRREYADAGIPYYWVVDLGEPGDRVTLTAHHLAGAFGAVTSGFGDADPVVGVFTTTEPFPIRIDLDALV